MAQKNRESKDFRPFHAQVTLSQQASLNSIHCLKQDSCRPIGGYSIWTHFGTQEISRPLVLVSAAMDTRSMFPRKSSPGSISDGSALVSLLAAAHALGNISSDDYEMLPNQIMFAVFQGEAFSYTGSRRFLHDLKEFKCQNEDNGRCALPIRTTMDFKKISLRSFSSHISLTHIYGDNLFLHPAKNGNSAELVELVRNVSKELSSQDLYKDATPTLPELPPSTAVPFSITLPNLPSLVIAGYDEQISNPYYHSFQDISSELSVSLICDAATLTAQSALAAAADNELKNVQDLVSTVRADCDLVSKLIYCFTKNLNCVLSQELGIPLAKLETSSGSTVASRYSGQYYPVREIDSITGTQRLVFELLTKFSELKQQGPQCSSNEDCSKSSGLGYGRCENGFCTTSMARYHEAYDPGIELDYDSLVFEVVNSSCPNWAESLTSLGEIRLFRVEKNSIVVGMLSAGFAVFLSSALILKYSSHYFSSHFKI